MIDIKTGKDMSRGNFLKGGLAAIIASGSAPWLAGSANASVGRGMMRNVGARNAAMFGGGNPTAKDYVQDGLVAMWDGIENAGWGVHDEGVTNWIDIAGGKSIPLNSGIVFDSNCAKTTSDFSETKWGAIGAFNLSCIQVCFVRNVTSTQIQLLAVNQYSRQTIGVSSSSFGVGLRKSIASSDTSKATTITSCYGSQSVNIPTVAYIGISKYTSYGNDNYATSLTGRFSIGGGYNDGPFYGKIYSIRAYSRDLTESEVSRNYAIDKARFNLT